jgi:eukaryotic-like serine/threonine-protein kinase
MAGTVTLKVVRGVPNGVEYTFEDHAVGALGRAEGCMVRLPNDFVHLDVSRHHCLLDIDPPRVRVRDLGSRNGTFVNGEDIGRRPRDRAAEWAEVRFPACPLHAGDELIVGGTVFRVEVSDPEPEPEVAGVEEALCV